MTDPGYTHYIVIVDRSGSMTRIKADTEGGVRQFAAGQEKVPGRKTLSLYQFDDRFDAVTRFGALEEAEKFTLAPRGMTALYGAIGRAFTEEGQQLEAMDEAARPGKVVVVIATDGEENSSHLYEWSRQYGRQRIRDMVTRQQEEYSWQVTYIGANQDAFAAGGAIGVPQAATMDYASSHAGTQSAWSSVSRASAGYASGQSVSVAYSDQDREDALRQDGS